jgi:chromosome segregation ATPase
MSLSLSEGQDDLLRAKEAINVERETLRTDARTLANLRSEHARLKDDFRSLFTSNERVKSEYCNLQTDYKALKTSYNQLKLQQTELTGQLHESKEQLTMMDVEHSKAVNRCEVLAHLNNSLEEDRKSLMNQVLTSVLVT